MAPNSSGNWNNASIDGLWALNLNNVRANSNNNIGFRSDSVSPRNRQRYGGTKGDAFRRTGAKSAFRRLSGRPDTIWFERQAVVLQ